MVATKVRVAVRVRPLLPSDGSVEGVEIDERYGQLRLSSSQGIKCFDFPDGVIGGPGRHAEVYSCTAAPLIERLFEGFNATVLAYGQTGSGKTYTMGTAFEDGVQQDGVVPRAICEIFERCESLGPGVSATVQCSLVEVYNEEVRDLLAASREPLNVRDGAAGGSGGVVIAGLEEHSVASAAEVLLLMKRGLEERVTGCTEMNARSSRSHMILTLKLEVQDEEKRTVAKLHLVDLAGSERAKRTGATGERLKEGIGINKSLLALGNVIARLVELGDRQISNDNLNGHVPYRDSALTRVLADSLGGSAMTCMIACASPSAEDADESTNTLRWASRATKITNQARTNVLVEENAAALNVAERAELASLREQNSRMRESVKELSQSDQKSRGKLRRLNKKHELLERKCAVLEMALPPEALAAALAPLKEQDKPPVVAEEETAVRSYDEEEESPHEEHSCDNKSDDDDDDDDDCSSEEEGEEEARASIAEKELRSLEIEEECMENLRVHYEHAIAKLENEVSVLETERGKLLSAKDAEKNDKATRVLREKARELERRLDGLRKEAARARQEVQRCAKLKRGAEDEARKLRAQVDSARRTRGELNRTLQHNSHQHATEAKSWRREARRLQRERDRVTAQKQLLADKFQRHEKTSARQLEEQYAALRKLRTRAAANYSNQKQSSTASSALRNSISSSAIKNKRRPVVTTLSTRKAANPKALGDLDRRLEQDSAALPDWLRSDLETECRRLRSGTTSRLLETLTARLESAEEDLIPSLAALLETTARHRLSLAEAYASTTASKREEHAARLKVREIKQRTSEKLDLLMCGVSVIASNEMGTPKEEETKTTILTAGGSPMMMEQPIPAAPPAASLNVSPSRLMEATILSARQELLLLEEDEEEDESKRALLLFMEQQRQTTLSSLATDYASPSAMLGQPDVERVLFSAADAEDERELPKEARTKVVNDEYSARRARMRRSLGTEDQPLPPPPPASHNKLEAVEDQLSAVMDVVAGVRARAAAAATSNNKPVRPIAAAATAVVVSDLLPETTQPELSRALRETVAREYPKPWLVNAAVNDAPHDEAALTLQLQQQQAAASSKVQYERAWRTNTKIRCSFSPPPPPLVQAAETPPHPPPACVERPSAGNQQDGVNHHRAPLALLQ